MKLKKGMKVKILSVDLRRKIYRESPSMKEFEGKIGVLIGYVSLKENFVGVDMGDGIHWGFYSKDIKVIKKEK